ncbi:hypothetical protein [Paenibacillus cremeus]|uniref:Uncharacterized protein n=1 Tax=Paenibacillus cremeus TaxID=2163881 RepID=A0A559KF56_9BACL|nr:hypothetical protein [Paenibacillus cremeus]TVY10751.1 hypothetical protein FPZ49_06520 [Paenibacillus cremeus]
MVGTFYLVVNAIAVILFAKYHKRLHALEILVYWSVSTYLYQNFSALCYMNFKTLWIPDEWSYAFTHFLNRVVLLPLLMVMFLDLLLALTALLKKLLLLAVSVTLLVGMEWLSHYLGVLIHQHWQLWWSFAFWLSALVALAACMKGFRLLLYKGGTDW